MLHRLNALCWNTFREGVRARLLLGLLAALAASAVVGALVGQLAIREQLRVLADTAAASVSLFSGLAAVVFMATSLHRDVEQRTLFPVLARPVARYEVLLGKWAGAWILIAVFSLVGTGVSLLVLALVAGASALAIAAACALTGLSVWTARRQMRRAPDVSWLVAGVLLLGAGWAFASPLTEEATLLLHAAVLTLQEGAILLAIGVLFSSFSRPAITGLMTAGIWIAGRNADTLAHMSARQVGAPAAAAGAALAPVLPNMQLYAPSRSILLGTDDMYSYASYVWVALGLAAAYSVFALVVASWVFSKRDLT